MKNILNIFRENNKEPKHTVMASLVNQLDWQIPQSQFRLRFAQVEDLERIVELERRAYHGYEAWELKDFQHDWVHNPHGVYLLIESLDSDHLSEEYRDNGGLVAAIIGRFRSRGSHISHVIVDPAYQGRGLGKLLMSKWMAAAEILKTPRVSLEVRQSNFRAQQMYEGFGFVKRNTKYFYYYDNHEDAIEMVYEKW